MRNRAWLLLPLLLLGGCLDGGDQPTSPAFESAALSLLGGLDVGEAITLSGADAERLVLPGGDEGARYMVVPFFAADDGSQRLQVDVGGTGFGFGAAGSARAASPAADADVGFRAAPGVDDDFHRELREWELEHLGPRLRTDRQALRSAIRQRVAGQAVDVPEVGEIVSYQVINPARVNAGENICQNPVVRPSRVVAVNEDVIVAIDTLAENTGLTQENYDRVAREFSELVWPVETTAFGEPTDIDENNRVIILFTPVVNDIGAGGFFFSGDLFPPEACAASNFAEIFYIIVPQPGLPADFVAELATSIVGHEFQHLVNASRRIYVNDAETFEAVWLNEGLSHIAEELLFYAATQLEPEQNLTIEQIVAADAAAAFDQFQSQNIGRFIRYLEDPRQESLLGIDNLETRGAIWAYLRYAADHYAEDENAFWFALVNSRIAGVPNLAQVLPLDPVDLMQTWTASVFTDDLPSLAASTNGIPPLLSQPSWDFRDIYDFFLEDYPLDIIPLGTEGSVSVRLRGGGAAFISAIVPAGGQGTLEVSSGGAAPPDELRLSVVRFR